jgi:hypothetical protein
MALGVMRQLSHAFPVRLAEAIGSQLSRVLKAVGLAETRLELVGNIEERQ